MRIRVVPQATEQQARANLGRLVQERHEDCAGLSRLIGRSPGYVGRYLRGSPKVLAERDRGILAEYLGIPEQQLGAPM